MYAIRKALPEDTDTIVSLMNGIIEEFRQKGITMWQKGYPNRDSIVHDIADGGAYVAVRGCDIVGYMYVCYAPEEFHSTLRGQWDDSNCSVMHRLLTDPSTRGTGQGRQLFEYWEQLTREHGCTSMRTETDQTNLPMRHLCAKFGLVEKGLLRFDNSDKIGFEKVLS